MKWGIVERPAGRASGRLGTGTVVPADSELALCIAATRACLHWPPRAPQEALLRLTLRPPVTLACFSTCRSSSATCIRLRSSWSTSPGSPPPAAAAAAPPSAPGRFLAPACAAPAACCAAATCPPAAGTDVARDLLLGALGRVMVPLQNQSSGVRCRLGGSEELRGAQSCLCDS